jgi:hypothetical protein
MKAISAARIESPTPKLIAPWWQTALFITLFLGIAVGGAFFQWHARREPGGVATASSSRAALPFDHRYGIWAVCLRLERRPSLVRNQAQRSDWAKVGKPQACARRLRPRVRVMGIMVSDRAGSLFRDGPCSMHPDLLAPTGPRGFYLDWRFHQRRIQRRVGLSRLFSETIRDPYAQPVDCVVSASCALRDFPRLSRHRSVREDHALWRTVWLTRPLARQPAARHDGPCVVGYFQRYLWNLITFSPADSNGITFWGHMDISGETAV